MKEQKLLNIGDSVYYTTRTGVFAHQYDWEETKVFRISKTLAYCENGMKVYRKPRRLNNGGYRYFVKDGNSVYPKPTLKQ